MWLLCNSLLRFFSPPVVRASSTPLQQVDIDGKIDEPPKTVRPFVYFISGGFGGICSVIVGHPLDTIKTRLQTMPVDKPPLYRGTFDCFRKIISSQGIRGLYLGITIQLASVAPLYAVSFSGYGVGKSVFEIVYGDTDFTTLAYFIGGAFSGVLTTLITAPTERVKVILQVQSAQDSQPRVTYKERCGPRYDSSLDVVVKLYKEGGVRSVFKGAMLTLMRDVPAFGTYFMTYELMKLYLVIDATDVHLKPYKTIIAGGVAGIANWLVAIPFDTVKSKLQSAPASEYPNGIRDVLKEIYFERGILSLYSGLFPVLLRSFPANAACFLGFEYCKNTLTDIFV